MWQIFIEYAYVYGIYSAFWFSVMLSLMNKCYRIYTACILFINMIYTFGICF